MSHDALKSFEDKLRQIADYDKRKLLYDRESIKSYVGLSSKNEFAFYADSITQQGEQLAAAVDKQFDNFIAGIESFQFTRYPHAYNQALWGDHDGCYSAISSSEPKEVNIQREKNIAKALFNIGSCDKKNVLLDQRRLTRNIGEIMDYEVPLINNGNRNIDLVSVQSNTLYILELKKRNSKETLLRCLLESYTYSCLADRSRLKESFGLGQDASICICPLIFDDSAAYQELTSITKNAQSEQNSSFVKLANRICEHEHKQIKIEYAVIKTDLFKQSLTQDCEGNDFNPSWLQ